MLITELNTMTGDLTEREMTQDEQDAYSEALAKADLSKLEFKAKEAARQSALDKLAALGLSPEEVAAITGN